MVIISCTWDPRHYALVIFTVTLDNTYSGVLRLFYQMIYYLSESFAVGRCMKILE